MSSIESLAAKRPHHVASLTFDRLLACLLSERHVLRMICAPEGFGKTSLARAYADAAFPGGRVLWASGKDPAFLCALDDDRFAQGFPDDPSRFLWDVDFIGTPDSASRLIIIDDLYRLDVLRAKALSKSIDMALEAGDEVVITSTPANDCLNLLQPDRVLISAKDMLVKEDELCNELDAPPSDHAGDDQTHQEPMMLDGHLPHISGIPSLIWLDRSHAVTRLIDGFMAEALPDEFVLPAIVMLMMGKGAVRDLECLGIGLGGEVLDALIADYPLFGLSRYRETFETVPVLVEELAAFPAIARAFGELAEKLSPALVGDIAALLVKKGDVVRALENLNTFMEPAERERWLGIHGWDILDLGHAGVLVRFLSKLGEPTAMGDAARAISAWAFYLTGNRYGAMQVMDANLTRALLPGLQYSYLVLAMRLVLDGFSGYASTRQGFDGPGGIALDVPLCQMQCLASRDGCDTVIGCPMGIGEQADTCANWALVHRAQALEYGHDGQSSATDETIDSLPALLLRASRIRRGTGYRLALLSLCRRAQILGLPSLKALEGEMARVLLPVISHGITRITEALLVAWLDSRATSQDGAAPSSIFDERIRMSSNAILASLNEMRSERGLSLLARGIPAATTRVAPMVSIRRGDHVAQPQAVTREEPNVYMRFLGGFEVVIHGVPSALDVWRKRHLKALLTYLAISRGGEVSRESLFEKLWPESDTKHARDSLYALWGTLRKALADEGITDELIIHTEESCRLNRALVETDLFEFERITRLMASNRLEGAERMAGYSRLDELYRGDLLDIVKFEDLLTPARVWLRDMYVDSMISASGFSVERDEPFAGLWFARKAFEQGIGREDVFRCLMRAQMASGQRNAAKKTFEECRKYMYQEFGIPPSQETLDVFNELMIPKYRRRH